MARLKRRDLAPPTEFHLFGPGAGLRGGSARLCPPGIGRAGGGQSAEDKGAEPIGRNGPHWATGIQLLRERGLRRLCLTASPPSATFSNFCNPFFNSIWIFN